MCTKYMIKDGCVYFNCEFNEPLDNYIDIIKNCTQIVFSNYCNYTICIETKNQYNCKYHDNYINNKFNHPLANSLDHQTQLVGLTFGLNFNHPLKNSLNQLTQLSQLTFGNNFNCPLENSLNHLTQLKQLTFETYFNQPN